MSSSNAQATAVGFPLLSARTARLAVVAIQLGLLVVLARIFGIEESVGFNRIAPIIFIGFLANALAPLKYRKPIFLFVSLAAIEAIFPFPNSLVLVAIGLTLIGACHLPVPHLVRVFVVIAIAVGLALFRADVFPSPIDSLGTAIIPILGAMFMFRLVIYLYDLRHMKKKLSIWDRLSYFFLLPNVCFPLFPVVDLQSWLRTYYDKEDILIYQKGVLWIFRGMTHLLMYRVVYHYLMPGPDELTGLFNVLQYMLATYLLYLRISGQFHMIVGILCLFGFNLPETHHLYYLASSFNDYWRRINIYWKDFMMKIFFYPSFMKLRKLGTTPALVISTLIVFAGTWILHSYQWFWLQGSFPITWPDALFWGILGGLVAVNSVWESKKPRKAAPASNNFDIRRATTYAVRVLGMFVLLTTLWSLWSSESVGEFLGLLMTAGQDSVTNWLLFLAILVGIVGVGVLAQYLIHRGWELTITGSAPSFARSAAYTIVGTCLLLGFSQPGVTSKISENSGPFVESIKSEKLNARDEDLLARGYYEGLLSADKYTSGLAVIQTGKPRNWDAIMDTDAVQRVDGVLQYSLIPNFDDVLKDERFITNSFGMHDIEYTREKPDGTTRVAFLGASYEMGAGVSREKTFDALVEHRLNQSANGRVEVMNMSVGGYSLLHNAMLMEDRVRQFEPDHILLAIHTSEARRMETHLRNLIEQRVDVSDYPEVERVLMATGIEPDRMPRSQMRARIAPFADEVIAWSLARIAQLSLEQGIQPTAVFVPLTEETDGMDNERFELFSGMLSDNGFRLINLDGAFIGRSSDEVQLAPWDTHLGPLGHELLAQELHDPLAELLWNAPTTRDPDTLTSP